MNLFKSLHLKDVKKLSTPLETAYLSLKDGVLLKSNQQYREALGKFLYLSTVSRPDVSAAVRILCKMTNLPNHYDWNTVKRLARYIIGTADLKLKNSACDNPRLVEYINSNWGEDKTEYRSTSGSLVYGNSLIN